MAADLTDRTSLFARLLAVVLLLGISAMAGYRLTPGRARPRPSAPEVRQQGMGAPATATTTTLPRPARQQRLLDSAGYFDPYTKAHFEDYLEGMHRESDVDVRIELLTGLPDDDLTGYALRAMRDRGIGGRENRRGMLLAYDFVSQRMRIEVGDGLQGVFPDGFTGYLMREQAASFFAVGNPDFALRTTLFMINYRLREAALDDPYDPRAMAFIQDRARLASGGGATVRAGGAVKAAPIIGHPSTPEARARFAPAPTPAEALRRYEEWLRDGENQLDVPLFADGTIAAVSRFPMTQAYQDYVLYGEYGHRYTVIERGDLAMLVYTDTPLISPHFFRHVAAGWQLDLGADVRDSYECVGSNLTWSLRDSGDPYYRAFADLYVRYPNSGIVRVRAGDNRFLPMTHARRG